MFNFYDIIFNIPADDYTTLANALILSSSTCTIVSLHFPVTYLNFSL